jgi:hypothetical protein
MAGEYNIFNISNTRTQYQTCRRPAGFKLAEPAARAGEI